MEVNMTGIMIQLKIAAGTGSIIFVEQSNTYQSAH